jgi:glyoxylase-like metal-dependent hydrolase (beta-lactamase superfamily II)
LARNETLPDHLLVLERGWLSANSVLFLGRDGTAVVDTGYVTHAQQTLGLIGDALAARSLDRILNTHLHSDHCGGNAMLQQRYSGVHTSIPAGEAALVERWDEDALSFRSTGQNCPRFRFEAVLKPGDQVTLGEVTWEIHAAPGHDPHAVILFEPSSRVLISADALWENGFGVVFPELVGEPSFDEVASTLDLIETLIPQTVIPGHGRVFTGVGPALKSARRRLESFSQNPSKHARHALKVLLKFRLLEAQSMSVKEWKAWIAGTPYFETVRARFFESLETEKLGEEILNELIGMGAASRNAVGISNCG